MNSSEKREDRTATLAGGCFWCTEAVFDRVRGVDDVESGYTGGSVENPTYGEVCSGTTGHAEAIRVRFDPEAITYEELLEIFFGTHDPTTLNRQGADVGTQYRSAVFYHSPEQKQAAEEMIRRLEADDVFGAPIVTEVDPAGPFYPAEQEHKDYYREHPERAYCQTVIRPKVAKLRERFQDKLKEQK